jgi:hypothetical protein
VPWLAALAEREPELAQAVNEALADRDRGGFSEFLAEPLLDAGKIRPDVRLRAT